MNKQTKKRKITYNFHRREGERYYRGNTVSPDEETGIEQTWKGAFLKTRKLIMLLGKFFIKKNESLDSVIEQTDFDIKTYWISYLAVVITGSLGPVLYLLTGGRKYFNNWYIMLLPVLGALICLGTLFTVKSILHFFWNKNKFSFRKNQYLKYLFLLVMFTPITWLMYPLKHIYSSWDRHVFFLSFAITAYIAARAVLHKSEYFRKRDIYFSFIVIALAYYIPFFFLTKISSFFVRMLRL